MDSLATPHIFFDWTGQELAAHGYVALVFATPNPASDDEKQWAYGFNGGISTLKQENQSHSSPIYGLVSGQFGIIGFSSGGAGVIEAAASNPDVNAAVALAPGDHEEPVEQAAQQVTVPIQLQVGSEDGLVSPESVRKLYDLIPSTSKEFLEIPGANHVGFLDEGMAKLGQMVDKPNKIDISTQHQTSSQHFTDWFNHFLKGQAVSQ